MNKINKLTKLCESIINESQIGGDILEMGGDELVSKRLNVPVPGGWVVVNGSKVTYGGEDLNDVLNDVLSNTPLDDEYQDDGSFVFFNKEANEFIVVSDEVADPDDDDRIRARVTVSKIAHDDSRGFYLDDSKVIARKVESMDDHTGPILYGKSFSDVFNMVKRESSRLLSQGEYIGIEL